MQEVPINLHSNLTYSKGYITLDKKLSLKPSIQIEGVKYNAKNEFHISILAVKKYIPLLVEKIQITEDQARDRLISEVDKYVTSSAINFESYSDEVRKVSRDDRSSIVILVSVINIDGLYKYLSDVFSITFDKQPTHITLYTLANGLGIGINSYEDLDRLSSRLDKETTEQVISAISN